MNPRVFLVEPPRNVDATPAEEYGELRYIFTRSTHRSPLFDVNDYVQDALTSLEQARFDPETDYFCLTGGLLPVAIILYGILSAWRSVNVLMFAATESRYVKRTLNIETFNIGAMHVE